MKEVKLKEWQSPHIPEGSTDSYTGEWKIHLERLCPFLDYGWDIVDMNGGEAILKRPKPCDLCDKI